MHCSKDITDSLVSWVTVWGWREKKGRLSPLEGLECVFLTCLNIRATGTNGLVLQMRTLKPRECMLVVSSTWSAVFGNGLRTLQHHHFLETLRTTPLPPSCFSLAGVDLRCRSSCFRLCLSHELSLCERGVWKSCIPCSHSWPGLSRVLECSWCLEEWLPSPWHSLRPWGAFPVLYSRGSWGGDPNRGVCQLASVKTPLFPLLRSFYTLLGLYFLKAFCICVC